MKVTTKINPAILGAAAGMLQPYIPELSPQTLLNALKEYGAATEPAAQKPTAAAITKPLTRRQAADFLGVHVQTINRYMNSGLLHRVKVGPRLVRIDPASVRTLLENNLPEAN